MLTFFRITLGARVIVMLLDSRNDLSSDFGAFRLPLTDLSRFFVLSSSWYSELMKLIFWFTACGLFS